MDEQLLTPDSLVSIMLRCTEGWGLDGRLCRYDKVLQDEVSVGVADAASS